MKFLISFLLFVAVQARVIDDKCDGVIIRNKNYNKEVLVKLDSPYQLAIDYDTNVLFFSYTSHTKDYFNSAYVNLKTNEHGIIKGISGGFANTVNPKSHTVYLGGNDGIYQYDFNTNTAANLNFTDDNIWQMFFKDVIYYTSYPDENVYMIKDGVKAEVPELKGTNALLVAVANNGDFYFSNSSGLFKRKEGNFIQLTDFALNGITADISGNLYFSTPMGLFYINEDKVEKLTELDDVYGIAVGSDGNIIYATSDSLVRLTSTDVYCPEPKKNMEENKL